MLEMLNMEFSKVAERISQKIGSKGHTVDPAVVERRLRLFVEEFSVQDDEAERSVIADLARQYAIPDMGMGKSGSERKAINEVLTGEWVTVEGKIVALSHSPSPSIKQTGIIADQSGAMRFVIWTKSNLPEVEPGMWYRFDSAVVDAFNGVPSLKAHSGTIITPVPHDEALIPTTTPLADLSPGVASVHGKVVQEWETTHERMLQSGLIGDETGTVKFVLWHDEGKEKLVPGTVYSLYYALVDEFNGRLSLTLNTATAIPEEGDIPVNRGDTTIRGVLVSIAPTPGSGLIRRCPVEGCNRLLSRQNYCPVHEIQIKFHYDLRIKGWLDTGERTSEVLMPRQVVEALTGITLDAAKEIAENSPLGMDEVAIRIRDKVAGRYLVCSGKELDRTLLVASCEIAQFDPITLADLINRASTDLSSRGAV
ncbi:MAG: nucleotide-binding protein [Methanomicrobiales archaeon]|nr:nucleotide-binding protein [Methanomicrobiales archaeon]